MKITITSFEDNSFSFVVIGSIRLFNVSLSWQTDKWVLWNFTTGIALDMGSDVLPDWTSIMQHLQELN
jgi:hypothetical protein